MGKIILIALLTLTQSFQTNALSVSIYGQNKIDHKENTHIFVIGYAGGLIDQLFKSAVARAKRYQEIFPKHQLVFIGPRLIDEKSANYNSAESYRRVLGRLHLNSIVLDDRWLLSDRLMDILKDFKNIQSIDFFSHSAVHRGIGLEDIPSNDPRKPTERFNQATKGLQQLKRKFLPNAFIFIHGCNSGFQTAPQLAKILNIPVAGSLTSTNTQELFTDHQWYFNDSGRFPPELSRSRTNTVSYSRGERLCASGHCHRMQPEHTPYRGGWGTLTAGLPHYKFFCGSAQPSNACKKAMALSLLGYPSINGQAVSGIDAFRENVKDLLCPTPMNAQLREECFLAMENSLTDPGVTYAGLRNGKTVSCNFESCDVDVECGAQCIVTRIGPNPQPRTTQNEFRAYLEGYQLLLAR